jgi:hypothetical protein
MDRERNNLVGVMEATSWRVAGADGAAAQLGIPPSRLKSRLKALGVEKPDPGSLYARLGELFGRATGHPQLGRFWKGRSTYGVLREERLLIAYLSSAAGGPTRYVGRDMKLAHRDLGIGASDWEIFRGILRDTLEALRVPSREARRSWNSPRVSKPISFTRVRGRRANEHDAGEPRRRPCHLGAVRRHRLLSIT